MAETEKKNVSIHPNPRKAATKERRAKRHAQNRTLRANLYREFQGEKAWKHPESSEWHQRLDALSAGSAA